ncbi:unnamed protein product [Cuscuta campestris]|uniref:Zinc finger GRF-type domain-containing protein n=1 Tax=Cuscuta campestris TaxID=132261 RepID=A0A484L1V6_9ASTE|nr:unnamed protein product [Cuscuta campestris]
MALIHPSLNQKSITSVSLNFLRFLISLDRLFDAQRGLPPTKIPPTKIVIPPGRSLPRILSSSNYSFNSTRMICDYGEWLEVPTCRCRKEMKILTSWTDKDPGRRMWKCDEFFLLMFFGVG